MNKNTYKILIFTMFLLLASCLSIKGEKLTEGWELIATKGQPTARHEAALVAFKDKLYLIGGRRINPVDVFDPKTRTWTAKSKTPIELHHFQAVVYGDAIYLIGAMTGNYPFETPLDRVIIYYPERDEFEFGDKIPQRRQRGGAGAVLYKDKIYVVGGITNGHYDGYVPWLDEYDPKTGKWRVLPDAPNTRDHFQAAVIGNKLYSFAGRTTRQKSNQSLDLTIKHGNIFDFEKETWLPVTESLAIPTKRAGNSVLAWKDNLIIGGGESSEQVPAHNEVESFDTKSQTWSKLPNLKQGRHGSGFAVIGDYVYTASGSGNRGGGPELTTIERFDLLSFENQKTAITKSPDSTFVYSKFHTVEIPFVGEMTSEDAEDNPFLNYRLEVEFKHAETNYKIRGFYAADGNAGETGASKGNIWKVRFTPDKKGLWEYEAKLRYGKNIALSRDSNVGKEIKISNFKGKFNVVDSDKDGRDFRANGRLIANGGYYRFKGSGKYWIKGGANSPENFLAFADFDGTYRSSTQNREGEAKSGEGLHQYPNHIKDWQEGDPTWRNGKGKAIIGAVNYLASRGMNSIYFLTMNINGDGKDVWMYLDHKTFTRFDVSKLEQWEILFRHMQKKGIMLHVVTQETENELLLDGGNTESMRQLYYQELIARFGHHLALTWNLGEENGPADFSPKGQNTEQRKAMANFLKVNDPYDHPVILHTHSQAKDKEELLPPLLGFKDLDGLSFQVDDRRRVNKEVIEWRSKAKNANHGWLITMDEIGMWHTGTLPDGLDPKHDSLRRYALWGSLLAGSAGVEWYFGAKYPGNDLTSEDWRERENIWDLTHHAISFFDKHLPYWKMTPSNDLVNEKDAFCFAKKGEIYTIYTQNSKQITLNLENIEGAFSVFWYDPLKGGNLLKSNVQNIKGNGKRNLGIPPFEKQQDWVILVHKD